MTPPLAKVYRFYFDGSSYLFLFQSHSQTNPLYFMLPATLTASCAFLLPVSTAPMAIVHQAGKLHTWDIIKTGVGMNVISMLVIVGCISTYGVEMFDLQGGLPDWAIDTSATNHTLRI